MKKLENVEQKEAIASKVHELVNEINVLLETSKNTSLEIRFLQSGFSNFGERNSDLKVYIKEDVSY